MNSGGSPALAAPRARAGGQDGLACHPGPVPSRAASAGHVKFVSPVPGHAACPWRLYYASYYTAAPRTVVSVAMVWRVRVA